MSWEGTVSGVLNATQIAFGAAVIYTPPGGAPVEIANAPFRAAHRGIDTETGIEVLVERPEIAVKLADLPGGEPVPDATVERADGSLYRVEDATRDGEGAVVLHLHKVLGAP